MKRRAEQIRKDQQSFPVYIDDTEENQKQEEKSQRVYFKPAALPPVKQEKKSLFASFLETLKSADIHDKTQEFLKSRQKIQEGRGTPRVIKKIIPQRQPYQKIFSKKGKFWIQKTQYGKGLIQILKSKTRKITLIVFRNCIMKILFTGAFIQSSKFTKQETQCKQNHQNKIDIQIQVAQQPSGKTKTINFCIKSSYWEIIEKLELN